VLHPLPIAADQPGVSTATALRSPTLRHTPRPVVGWPEWLSLVAFGALVAVGMSRHDLWFDELQAWNVARSSHGLTDLVSQLRYEGHPVLWYLPLFALTRFTGDPRAMQALELLIALGSIAMVLFCAPYARWLRITVCATYFLVFEYTVMSRSYGLGVLCFLVALDLLARPAPAWRAGTVALVLLSWTSVLGAALAGVVALSLYLGGEAVSRVRWSRVDAEPRRLATWVVGSCALVAATCIPASDFASAGPAFRGDAAYVAGPLGRVLEGASSVWRGLAPVQDSGTWNTNILDGSAARLFVAVVLGLVLVVLIGRGLGSAPLAQRLWVLGVVAFGVFFAVVVRPTEVRYSGSVALVLLGATWFAAARDGAWLSHAGGAARVALAVVLAAQLVAGLGGLRVAVHRFAPNESLAEVARANGVDQRLVSANDFLATGLAGYLDVDVFSIAQQEWRRTLQYDEHQRDAEARLTTSAAWCEAQRVARTHAAPAGLLTSSAVPGASSVARVGGARLYVVEPGSTLGEC